MAGSARSGRGDAHETGHVQTPELPDGDAVEVPGRGTTFVRHITGPPDAATLLLLHGWTASADLNWFACYRPLGREFRVVAMDHRGHGRGIRSRRRFHLADCADDAAALCDVLGIHRVIPVGYSMGGAVAQLMWRRHPQLVRGLVLCATAASFGGSFSQRAGVTGLAALARLTPHQARRWLVDQLYLNGKAATWEPWAMEEAALHDWRMMLEAGTAAGNFDSRSWIGEIDAPTAAVVTMRDSIVATRRQIAMVQAIPGCEAFRVDGDHNAVAVSAGFAATLALACHSVDRRAG